MSCVVAITPSKLTRQVIQDRLTNLVWVYCHAPINVLIARDVKGLYARYIAGEVQQLAGMDAPYDIPRHPNISICTDGAKTPEQNVEKILTYLSTKKLVSS